MDCLCQPLSIESNDDWLLFVHSVEVRKGEKLDMRGMVIAKKLERSGDRK